MPQTVCSPKERGTIIGHLSERGERLALWHSICPRLKRMSQGSPSPCAPTKPEEDGTLRGLVKRAFILVFVFCLVPFAGRGDDLQDKKSPPKDKRVVIKAPKDKDKGEKGGKQGEEDRGKQEERRRERP